VANLQKRLPFNVSGDFFVDSTCINCDTCRQLAPETFGDSSDYSFVRSQPQDDAEGRRATRALLACPTGSIGTLGRNRAHQVKDDFPLPVEDEVFYCGFNSPKSYGGNSYFVRHPDGNWLIDSPKFLPFLVGRLEAMGGVRFLFLTHQDDVADAARFAAHFGSQRIIHRAELSAQPDSEIVLEGSEPMEIRPGFRIIPTPGHTAGHCVLLLRDRFLFTGDHLSWDRDDKCLSASYDYCWDSWADQTRSMASLLNYQFEWVLPGHGQQVKLAFPVMRRELEALITRMKQHN
jgi:glyoxylase-like metal-dependent hydrolase (beta-lactamase superfamily II)/ferredoxin